MLRALLDAASGRSSDLQAAYLLQLPSRCVVLGGTTGFGQCFDSERSFLLTAAGQSRMFAGFPFQVNVCASPPEARLTIS